MNKNTIIFYQEWIPLIESLPNDKQLVIYKAILNFDGNILNIQDAHTKGIYDFIIKKVQENHNKYQDEVEKRRLAGIKSGESRRKRTSVQSVQECSTKISNVKQSGTKRTDNDNDNDSDNVNDYKKNNIKKENDFVLPNEDYLATDIVDNTQSTDIILETNTNEVVVERNKQYSQDDLITNEMMVLDCFVEAGISVFGDDFGSKLVKDISLECLYDKKAIMQWGKHKLNRLNIPNTLEICKSNNATYKKLYSIICEEFEKEYKPLAYINTYLAKKLTQLTLTNNDNAIQRNTNISGSNQQEQPENTERYITAGTTTSYGTGAEALQRYLEDNVEGYKR